MSSIRKTHIAIFYWLSILLVGCGESPQAPQQQNGAEKNTKAETENSTQPASDANEATVEVSTGPVKWKRVTFPEIGISVEIPTSAGKTIDGMKFESSGDGIKYFIRAKEFPQGLIDKLESIQIGSLVLPLTLSSKFTKARDAALKAGQWSLTESTLRFEQGHPAIEFSAESPRDQTNVDFLAIVVGKRRNISIRIHSPRTIPTRDQARRVLNSIQFQSGDAKKSSESEHSMTAEALLAEFNADPQATYTKYRDIPLQVSGVVLRHRRWEIKEWAMREVLIAPDEHVKQTVRMRADPLNHELRIKPDASNVPDICCIMKADDPWSQAATGAQVTVRAYLNEPGFGLISKLTLSDAEFVETEHEIKPVITAKEISKRFTEDQEKLTAELGAHFMVIEGRAIDYELNIPKVNAHIFLEGVDGQKLYCVTERKEKNPPKPGDWVRLYGEFHMLHEVDNQVLMQIRLCPVISSTPDEE